MTNVNADSATDIGLPELLNYVDVPQQAATRKARHPHLLPVWDAKANAPRSINLATVSRIAVDGQVHDYRA